MSRLHRFARVILGFPDHYALAADDASAELHAMRNENAEQVSRIIEHSDALATFVQNIQHDNGKTN